MSNQPQLSSFVCFECGFESTDESVFWLINVEPPSYSMRDPYPGYPGDLVCIECPDDSNEVS